MLETRTNSLFVPRCSRPPSVFSTDDDVNDDVNDDGNDDDQGAKVVVPPKLLLCAMCGDTGHQTCAACKGHGTLPSGGFFSSQNGVSFAKVVGTNWTALRRTKGWRHFEATETRTRLDEEKKKKIRFVTLAATCDREQKVEVPLKELKNRALWAAGWQQKESIEWDDGERDTSGALIGKPKRSRKACKRCGGEGKIACVSKTCKAGKAMQRQRAIQISVETRLKEVAKSDGVDPETKLKAKKAVKEMAREKEKEERRKRELKNRFGGGENDDDDDDGNDGNDGNATGSTTRKALTEADGSWADAKLRKRDELLEKWMRGSSSSSPREDAFRQ